MPFLSVRVASTDSSHAIVARMTGEGSAWLSITPSCAPAISAGDKKAASP
jgi:hypothetical protein